jgi:murein DD-endopeptidase MepM/ murein hydrolase activator NlpD
MIIPDGSQGTRQVRLPRFIFKLALFGGLVLSAILGFFILDYIQLCSVRQSYQIIANENDGLKGESRVLIQNLEEVKRSLRRVQDYTNKLGELTTVKVRKVSKMTGIGPLSKEEFMAHQQTVPPPDAEAADFMPLGVNIDSLVFKPVFTKLASLSRDANKHAFEMQHLLSNLSQQKSLLNAIPSMAPVNGWITSGFGGRISPFTGGRSVHQGLDIASPVGTAILAPADGVVVFTGAKEGFGNFIMIAHGYGIVSRYGHNNQNMVQPGQRISRGEQIGTVGMSGRTTGPHVHYEVWVDGRPENPRKFILEDLQEGFLDYQVH